MNTEDVVGHPEHLRGVAVEDPLDFIDNGTDRAPAVRLSKGRVAAPGAVVWTSARGNHRYRARSMPLPPDLQVARHVDMLAIRPGLRVEIADQRPGRRAHDRAVRTAKNNSRDSLDRSGAQRG